MKGFICTVICVLIAAPVAAQLNLAAPRDVARVLPDGTEVAFTSLTKIESHVRGLAGLSPGEDLLAVPIMRGGRVGILLVAGDAEQVARLRESIISPVPVPTVQPPLVTPQPPERSLTVREVLAPLQEVSLGTLSPSEGMAQLAERYNRAVAADPSSKLSRKVTRLLRRSAPKIR